MALGVALKTSKSTPCMGFLLLSLKILLQLGLSFCAFHKSLGNNINGDAKSELQWQQAVLSEVLANSRAIVLPVDELGLGNRLRTIAGFHAIASAYDLNLIVIWKPSESCSCRFDDIVEHVYLKNLVVISTPDFRINQTTDNGDIHVAIRELLVDATNSHNITAAVVFPRQFELLPSLFPAHIDVFLVHTRGFHAPHKLSCHDYLYSKSMFYQGLKLAQRVQRLVDTVKFGVFARNSDNGGTSAGRGMVIGVHIRAFDAHHDWPVVPPPSANSDRSLPALLPTTTSAKRFDEMSNIGAFVRYIEVAIHLRPSSRFFVASNSLAVKQTLVGRFGGDRIISLAIEGDNTGDSGSFHERSSLDGMVAATAEFFLLASTSEIVHSAGSSFAREAASVYSRRVIEVSKGPSTTSAQDTSLEQSLYYYSVNEDLPHCAMPEYIRRSKQQQLKSSSDDGDRTLFRRVCYDEGADREMCSVLYTVCPCACNQINSHIHCNVEHSNEVGKDCYDIIAESNGYSI